MAYVECMSMTAARLFPPYGGQPMDFSTVIEIVKLVNTLAKMIAVVVKLVKLIRETLKKREKKPP